MTGSLNYTCGRYPFDIASPDKAPFVRSYHRRSSAERPVHHPSICRISLQTLWPFVAFGLLAVHLLAMQIAGAAPIVCCLLNKDHEHPRSRSAARKLAGHGIVALIVGVAAGLLLGWLAMSYTTRDYLPVLTRFYNRVWWGGWELLFSLVIMLACWLPWNFWVATKVRRIGLGLLALVAATNLLYHFPPLLTVMAASLDSLADVENIQRITSAEFRALIAQPLVIAKTLHFVFAAIAVTGAWVMLTNTKSLASLTPETSSDPESLADQPAKRAAMFAVAGMSMQMLIGMWLVVAVPAKEQSAIMGGDPVAAGLLLFGIVLSLGALNQLGTIMMGGAEDCTQGKVRTAGMGVLVIATMMICVAGRLSGIGG